MALRTSVVRKSNTALSKLYRSYREIFGELGIGFGEMSGGSPMLLFLPSQGPEGRRASSSEPPAIMCRTSPRERGDIAICSHCASDVRKGECEDESSEVGSLR